MTEWAIIGTIVGPGVVFLVALTWMLLSDDNPDTTIYTLPVERYYTVKITPVFKTAPLERIDMSLSPSEADQLRAVLEHMRNDYVGAHVGHYSPYLAYGPFINALHTTLHDTLASAAK